VLEASAFYAPTELTRGILYELQDEPDRAQRASAPTQAHLEAKVREEQNDYRIHSALGLTYAGLGRLEDAIRHGKRAVALHPVAKDALEGPARIIHLALIYSMAGQQKATLRELDAVLSVPSNLSVKWLRKGPQSDGLRANSDFEALLRKHDPADQD